VPAPVFWTVMLDLRTGGSEILPLIVIVVPISSVRIDEIPKTRLPPVAIPSPGLTVLEVGTVGVDRQGLARAGRQRVSWRGRVKVSPAIVLLALRLTAACSPATAEKFARMPLPARSAWVDFKDMFLLFLFYIILSF
jgi:hypothetical protein